MKKYFFVLIIFCCNLSYANDSYLGSVGGNVFPVFSRDSIRMLKENIIVTMGRDSCFVQCSFCFVNNTNKRISILMGFPDYFSYPETHSKPLNSFTCKIDGSDQQVDKLNSRLNAESDEDLEWYEKWYCWHVYFQPWDTLFIENTYWGCYGGSLAGNYSFDYLIGTARTWNGTIGQGRVVFNYSDIFSNLFVDTSYADADKYLPSGLSRIIYTDSVVYSFWDYLPNWDERIRVSFFPFWGFAGFDTPQKYLYKINRSNEQYQQMINEIYARKGYTFNDKNLQEYFQRQLWYRKDPDFTIASFSEFEKFFIDLLKELKNN
jgi:hypothetical protein